MKKREKGEVTVFLSLVILLLLALIGGVLESASIQVSKNYRRGDLNRAVESVFAEYHQPLLDNYEIFAVESSYGTGTFDMSQVLTRMERYGTSTMDTEVTGCQLLTDQSGEAFFNQVVAYMENHYGIEEFKGILTDVGIWESQTGQVEKCEELDKSNSEEMQATLDQSQAALPEENNPLVNVSNLKSSSLLELVMSQSATISNQAVSIDQLPSNRTLQQGNQIFPAKTQDGALSTIFFNEYLLQRCQSAVDPQEGNGLHYELEYILEGKGSDKENLDAVVKKLVGIRFAANYLYLQTDMEKQAEAGALALSIATAAALPVLEEPVKQALLLGWAYGESVMDLRALLKGNKVALVKDTQTWQLSLTGLMTLGTEQEKEDGLDAEGGLDYQGYLRMLLYLEGRETKVMRELDVIETALRTEKGQESFRVDHCLCGIQVTGISHLRRGITYTAESTFHYR